MEVIFSLQHPSFNLPYSTALLTNWIQQIAHSEKKSIRYVQYIFVTDEEILRINSEFLNHYYLTDIITFNNNTPFSLSGEVFISIDTMTSNATSFQVNLDNEFLRLIVHGLLHLIGYNDGNLSEKQTMRNKEDYYIKLFYKEFV